MKEWAVGNAARSGQLGECRPRTQVVLSLLTSPARPMCRCWVSQGVGSCTQSRPVLLRAERTRVVPGGLLSGGKQRIGLVILTN